jgi:hypothetical protein
VSEPAAAPVVDLNSDLGEGFGIWTLGDDDALLDIVTSANVACGFHAGDPNILRRVCELAVSRDVAIGAQVSYRDLAGFGRRNMDVDPASLTNDVIYQIAALDGFARVAGSRVRYVKPHGALYNMAVHDEHQAAAVVAARVGAAPARRASRFERGHRGLRRPRVHRTGHSGASLATRRAAARPGGGVPAHGVHADDWPDAVGRRRRRGCFRSLNLRARRLPRSGGNGGGRAEGPC